MKRFNILMALLVLVGGMLLFSPSNVLAREVVEGPGDSGETEQKADSDELVSDSDYVGEGICSEPAVLKSIRLIGLLLMVAKFLVPLIIIVRGIIMFYKAVIADSDKEVTKSAIELGKKIAIGVLIFFVPAIVDGIFSLYDSFSSVESEYTACEQCLIHPDSSC